MIENLKSLDSLQKNETMSKAATELRISQSAVSKRIANLEHQLGKKLIVKKGRKVVLTLDGINILNKARPLLAEIQDLSNVECTGFVSRLSIGVSESILSSFGAKAIGKLNRKYDNLEILPHAHRSPVVIDRVQSGEYMLGLVAGSCIKAPDLDYKEIGYENFVIIMSGSDNINEIMTIEEISETWESIAQQVKKENIIITKRLESFFSMAQIANYGSVNALVPRGVAKYLFISKSKLKSTKIKRPIILIGRKTTFLRKDIVPVVNYFSRLLVKDLLILNNH